MSTIVAPACDFSAEVAQRCELVAAYDCGVSLAEVGTEAADLIRNQAARIDFLTDENESQQKQIQSLAQSNLKLRAENDGLRLAIAAMKGGAE
jgi:hypothetical protein